MNRNRSIGFFFLFSIGFAIFSSWDMTFTKYWKALVVLNHEIFHAITSLLTGGKFATLVLHANESGETISSGIWKYSIPFVYSAGYIGSSLTGGFLLYSGLKRRNARYSSLSFGIFLFLSTITFSQLNSYAFIIGTSWSMVFFLGALVGDGIASFLLILFGTAISLYSIYDLSDFVRSMKNSDAGILAGWIVENFVVMKDTPLAEKISKIGYAISICWSIISLSIIMYFLKISFFPKLSENELVLEKFLSSVESGAVNHDVAEWFLKKGVDLDGRPIPPKLVKELQEKGNPNE
jgi:hypothetical protein